MALRTLIVYSGPTGSDGRQNLYENNFQFFMKHGLPCSWHAAISHRSNTYTVALVLTNKSLADYSRQIEEVRAKSETCKCMRLKVITRENRCYDMESARIALGETYPSPLAKAHDFVVFVNCGLLGPLLPERPGVFWAVQLTSALRNQTKLTGLTINCGGKLGIRHPHVQSMLWATDAKGLEIILRGGALYNCGVDTLGTNMRASLINRYELGLSRHILKEGFQIEALFAGATRRYKEAQFGARCSDVWNYKNLEHSPHASSLLFWKASRQFPENVARRAKLQDARLVQRMEIEEPLTKGRQLVLPRYGSLGLNNYKMEVRRAALYARLSGRALCLPDLLDGKTIRNTKGKHQQVAVHAVYDLERLAQFVPIASDAECHVAHDCIDASRNLCHRPASLATSYSSASRLRELLTDMYGERSCLRLTSCLWSNFTLHEPYYLLWQHLVKPAQTRTAARQAAEALFRGSPYIALHWRFEESKCLRATNATALGLCFRSSSGLQMTTLHSLAATVERVRTAFSTPWVLLATDGRARSFSRRVDELRGLLGAGVVELAVDCPNCTRAGWWPGSGMMPSSTALSEVEQQLVADADFAIGSYASSWFWEACFTKAMARSNLPAFEVAMQAETMPSDRGKDARFPRLNQSLHELPFGFLGQIPGE